MNYDFYGNSDFNNQGSGGRDYYQGWDYFTLDDEKRARGKFSKFFFGIFSYILITLVITLGAGLLLIFLGGEDGSKLANNPLFQLVLNYGASYIIALPVLYLIVRPIRYTPRRKSKIRIMELLSLIAVSECAVLLGDIVGSYAQAFVSAISGSSSGVVDAYSQIPIYYTILFTLVLAPIVEEFIFRKLLMDKLGCYGERIVIIVSAVSYGIFHINNVALIFSATLIGFVLAYIYSKTGSIVYCIIVQVISNLFNYVLPTLLAPHIKNLEAVLPNLSETAVELPGEYSLSILLVGTYSIFIYAMLFIGIFLLFKYRRSIHITDRCEIPIPKNKRSSVIIGNAGAITLIAFSGISIVMQFVLPVLSKLFGGA